MGIHRINKFLRTVGITWEELRNKERQEIKEIIRKYDTGEWEEGMKEKSSLYLYIEEKKRMGYDECYTNSFQSELLAKARTNSMQLSEWYARGKRGMETQAAPYV